MVRGDVARAERELFAAINTFHTHPSPLVEWKTYNTLGRLYRSMKRPQDARQAFARAAEIVKTIASTIGDEQLRSTFLNSAAVREVGWI
jgi:Flp pilus assembly protein TadD